MKIIPASDTRAWQAAIAAHNVGPSYSAEYAAIVHPDSFLLAAEHGNAPLVFPFKIRSKHGHNDWYSPYGWSGISGGSPDSLHHFAHLAEQQGIVCSYVMQGPDAIAVTTSDEQRNVFMLDLNLSDEVLLAAMSKSSRYELRQWLASDHTVECCQPTLAAAASDLYQQTLQRNSASAVYFSLQKNITALLNSAIALSLGITHNGTISAITTFLYANGKAEYFMFASSAEGRMHSRGLLWLGISELRKRRVTSFNLGGGISAADSLHAFKKSMGGEEVSVSILKNIHHPEIFARLCDDAGKKVGDVASSNSYFPPYHYS